jgi:hypothetical protein
MAGCGILIDDPALHDKYNAPDGGDVFQRVSIERDDVRLQTGGDRMHAVWWTRERRM